MANEEKAVNTIQPAAVEPKLETFAISNEDLAEKVKTLEAEKAQAIEEGANWKLAFFKKNGKQDVSELTEEERFRLIAREEATLVKVGELDSQKEATLSKALKENKELKLALSGKAIISPASIGTHTEAPVVSDTLVTPTQIEAFKKRGWTDKDIERYKKNLRRHI